MFQLYYRALIKKQYHDSGIRKLWIYSYTIQLEAVSKIGKNPKSSQVYIGLISNNLTIGVYLGDNNICFKQYKLYLNEVICLIQRNSHFMKLILTYSSLMLCSCRASLALLKADPSGHSVDFSQLFKFQSQLIYNRIWKLFFQIPHTYDHSASLSFLS